MDQNIARIVTIVLAVLGLILVIVAMAVDDSVFTVGNGGCGVFECKGGGKTKNYPGDIGPLFEAAQAFGIMFAIVVGVAVICHGAQFANALPGSVGQYVRYLHFAGALFGLIFWIMVVCAYTVEYDVPFGNSVSLSDNTDVNFGIFFGVIGFITEVVVALIYPQAW
eukprot:TRINITY_DN3971_c0_g1_i1.p2 TRINITY_DN3971_c0_g1~~TRINITY_DN3971_c0_g1_i1.p2  ORF type:complete len:189 (+),score=56.13 TRINITY_DN3971_c0_g1_i1:71-568(+)